MDRQKDRELKLGYCYADLTSQVEGHCKDTLRRRHNIQDYDTQHNGIQHDDIHRNDTRHDDTIINISQHHVLIVILSIITMNLYRVSPI